MAPDRDIEAEDPGRGGRSSSGTPPFGTGLFVAVVEDRTGSGTDDEAAVAAADDANGGDGGLAELSAKLNGM